MNKLSNYSTLPLMEDVPFLEPSTTFGLLRAWRLSGRGRLNATFDLTVRDMPKNRNFLVFSGLEEIVSSMLKWRYGDTHLKNIQKFGFLDAETKKFLKHFHFSGSVYAMREGSIFFPGEPVVKVVAPLNEAALFYNFMVNVACSNVTFASKAARIRLAAPGKRLVTGAIRGHSAESMLKARRAAYLTGFETIVAPAAMGKYHLRFPRLLKSTHHHFIKSFDSELDAMRAIAKAFPDNEATLIVDTYDVRRGISNAVTVARELRAHGKGIHSIFIDSGNIPAHARLARRMLDQAGCNRVSILIGGDLNEWKLKRFIEQRVPFDAAMVVTELVTSADDPKLEAVYKIAEIKQPDGTTRPTMKLSTHKVSLPGSKQIFRRYQNGLMVGDTLGLEGERLGGEPLLRPVIRNGKLVQPLPSVEVIRKFIASQLKALPMPLRDLSHHSYPVTLSSGMKRLIIKTRRVIKQNLG